MNRKHMILLGGIIIAIGLLAAFSPRSIPVASSAHPQIEAGVSPFALQCDIKIPGGFAQCGSQASSCKSCHEVAGEDPINDKGDWHVSHAFGDFCEFCHGGNVQSPDKAEAHTGMVEPLGNLKVNCATCHSADYEVKGAIYAKTIAEGGSTAPAATIAATVSATAVVAPDQAAATKAPTATPVPLPTDTPAPTVEPKATVTQSPTLVPAAFAVTPGLGESVDYVVQYKAGPVSLDTPPSITGWLLAGVAIVIVLLVASRWRPARRARQS